MKVSDLIQALQRMPQDAEILTHANNHHTSQGETMRVGLAQNVFSKAGGLFVFVGNWNDYTLRQLEGTYKFAPTSWAVVRDKSGKLVEEEHVFEPEHVVSVPRYETREARTVFKVKGPVEL